MVLVVLVWLIILFYLIGGPMWNVFVKDHVYTYDPNEYQGEYLVTGEEWDIGEEVEERQEALKSSWIVQDSGTIESWEEDLIEEGFDETEAESEEHY